MEIIGEVALQIVVLAVMLVGLFGLLTLVIPGLTIIWVAALVYGLVTGFDIWSGILFGIITLLMLFGNVVDNLFMGAGARRQAPTGCLLVWHCWVVSSAAFSCRRSAVWSLPWSEFSWWNSSASRTGARRGNQPATWRWAVAGQVSPGLALEL